MHRRSYIPMNLQLFGHGGGGDQGGEGQQSGEGQQGAQNGAQGGSPASVGQSLEQVVAAAMAAVEARQQRAGNSVIKSVAEQNGMSIEDLTAAIEAKKAEKAKQLPPDVQKQLDDAKAQLDAYKINAEAAKIGAELGIVDVEVALTLINKDKVKITDKGVTGLKEELEALKTAKPYLFSEQKKGGAWGMQRSGGAPGSEKTVRDELREAMFGK